MNTFLELLRVKQWYKNLVVFVAIVFSLNLTNVLFLEQSVIAFLCLCLVSSSYYIINDIRDAASDKNHPEKKYRPIAAGKIGKSPALVISAILFIVAALVSYQMNIYFFYSVVFLFIFSQIYTFFLKKEPFADIIAISVNFVVKANAGTYLLGVAVSEWVIVLAFFLSMFLVIAKRKADKSKMYTEHLLNILLGISVSIIIVTYLFYIIFVGKFALILSFPLVFYSLFRYISFIEAKPEIARNPEKALLDKRMIAAIGLWVIIVVFVLYEMGGIL